MLEKEKEGVAKKKRKGEKERNNLIITSSREKGKKNG